MKYRVVIFPSEKLQEIANSFRARYDSHYALIPPHITLKEPFEVEDVKKLVNEIKRIVNKVYPFPLIIYKYRSFHPVSNTIYMGIQENEELLTLYNQLNSVVLEKKQKIQFVPHITIGQNLENAEFHDVLGRLKMETIHHEEICDRIQLLHELENGTWGVYETFLLGKDC